MKSAARKISFSRLTIAISLVSFFSAAHVSYAGGEPGGNGFPPAGEEALFVISARGPVDRVLLARYGEVVSVDGCTALMRTTQGRAELLSAQGMEIKRVMPRTGRAAPAAVPPPPYAAGSVEPEIRLMIERVDYGAVYSLLGDLSGENSVVVDGVASTIRTRNSYQTEGITLATAYCLDYFRDLGLDAEYDEYIWGNYNWRNVVAEQPGNMTPENIYIICAHLDDMPTGSLAPGADDNAGGATAVLITASILSDYSFYSTIRYVLFTGEEQGLLGSYYYVQDCLSAGDHLAGVLNFDMIAYDGNSDGSMEVYCGPMAVSNGLADLFIDTVSTYGLSLAPEKYTTAPSWSDQASFWDAGYPALAGIEDLEDFNPDYHTVQDTRSNCNIAFLTEIVKAAAGTIARLAVPYEPLRVMGGGDYDGDGTDDFAVFRPSSGLWAVRQCTRLYFGASGDQPVPGDYDGDGTAEAAVFRGSVGLWADRGVTRFYFGVSSDRPVPGDYDGDGCREAAVFRENSALWAVRGVSRVYYGTAGDRPVPGDYNGDGTGDCALFRTDTGLWAIRGISRLYFGEAADRPVPGDYAGDGTWIPGVYRPGSGLWAIRTLTRLHFGSDSALPVPADFDGDATDDPGIFRAGSGLWAVRGVTRTYYGGSGDVPVTR